MSAALDTSFLSLLAAGIGTVGLIVWPMFRSRQAMLLAQLTLTLGFSAHYALEGVVNASLLNLMGAIQIGLAMRWGESPRMAWIGRGMIPAILVVAVSSWSGWVSALSTIGMLLVATGRVQVDPARLRLLVVAGVPFWLAHDLIIGSPLVFADLFSLIVGVLAILRKERRDGPGTIKRQPTLRPVDRPHTEAV